MYHGGTENYFTLRAKINITSKSPLQIFPSLKLLICKILSYLNYFLKILARQGLAKFINCEQSEPNLSVKELMINISRKHEVKLI